MANNPQTPRDHLRSRSWSAAVRRGCCHGDRVPSPAHSVSAGVGWETAGEKPSPAHQGSAEGLLIALRRSQAGSTWQRVGGGWGEGHLPLCHHPLPMACETLGTHLLLGVPCGEGGTDPFPLALGPAGSPAITKSRVVFCLFKGCILDAPLAQTCPGWAALVCM